jgi:hypothetical protein
MDEAPVARKCPQCGQPLAPDVEACAACGRDDANPFTSPAPPPPPNGPKSRSFSLRLLFAVVTVICVSLGVSVMLPGLGVILGLVFVPAVIRAAAVMKRRQEAGMSNASGDQIAYAFVVSVGIMFVVWLASAIAFAVICFPLGLLSFDIRSGGGVGIIFAFGLGGLAGLAVFVWFTKKFWPRSANRDDVPS